jgi:regulatory protein
LAKITLSAEHLDRVALRYLNRFDSSVANLRRVLMRELRRAERSGDEQPDAEAAERLIDELLERFQRSSLLDDSRYAVAFASAQRGRGASRRLIAQKLRQRGVPAATVSDALSAADRETTDAELAAALKFVRKKRLGPHRAPELREAKRRRDLAALARAGFGFDVALKALRADAPDDAF